MTIQILLISFQWSLTWFFMDIILNCLIFFSKVNKIHTCVSTVNLKVFNEWVLPPLTFSNNVATLFKKLIVNS